MRCLSSLWLRDIAKFSSQTNFSNIQKTTLFQFQQQPIFMTLNFVKDFWHGSSSLGNVHALSNAKICSTSNIITMNPSLLSRQPVTKQKQTLQTFIQICSFSSSGCQFYSSKSNKNSNTGNRPTGSPTKMRMLKKKKVSTDSEDYKVVAYATADEYDLEELLKGFQKLGLYERSSYHVAKSNAALGLRHAFVEQDVSLNVEGPQVQGYNFSSASSHNELDCIPDITEVLHVVGQYKVSTEPREIFFFRDGSLVFWNIDELERKNVLMYVKQFCLGDIVSPETMDEQSESLPYTYAENKTRLSGGRILLSEGNPSYLERYAFSNALAHSVKLGVWETELDSYIDSIKPVAEELRRSGAIILPKKEVFLRLGQLYELRHSLTLSSDLLDTPDYYWDREHLELLYRRTCNYLSVSRRTEIMSDKLNNCMQLLELLKNYHGEEQSHRLERIIIYLIVIEVVFESLHFIIK